MTQSTGLWDLMSESVIASRDGRISGWNLAASTLYGWQPHEANGQHLAELFGAYPDDIAEALETEGVWEGTIDRIAFDGTGLTVRVKCATSQSLGVAPGEIVEVSSLLDSKHPAEIKLAASEYRYRNLFSAVAAAFWELDFSGVGRILGRLGNEAKADLAGHLARNPDLVREMMRATRVVDINERSVELFGPGTKRDLLAISLEHYWPQASHKDYAAAVIAAVSGQSHFICETRMRSLGGREFEALFTVSFLPGTVGRGSLLIGFTDISERIRVSRELDLASQREKMFYEIPSIAISEMDTSRLAQRFEELRAQGVVDLEQYINEHPDFVDFAMEAVTVIETNDAGARLCGAASREDLIGRSLKGMFEPGREAYRRGIQASWRGEAVFQSELRMRRLDGTFADTLFCRVVSLPYSRGRVLAAQLDITEQVQAREELERLQRQLTHASRISMLGELSASIAHEISQPITAIANNAVAAERIARQPAMAAKHLATLSQRVLRDAIRAGEIISRIRAMASNQKVELVDLEVTQVISDAHQLVARELRDHDILVNFAFDKDLPRIRGDRVQLQQVMVNLMMNAVQAMEGQAGQRALQISATAGGDTFSIVISDTGPGFPEGGEGASFRSFQSTKPNGLGLGLSICRSIIEGHGGQIGIANRENGGGARVTIDLPLPPSDGILSAHDAGIVG